MLSNGLVNTMGVILKQQVWISFKFIWVTLKKSYHSVHCNQSAYTLIITNSSSFLMEKAKGQCKQNMHINWKEILKIIPFRSCCRYFSWLYHCIYVCFLKFVFVLIRHCYAHLFFFYYKFIFLRFLKNVFNSLLCHFPGRICIYFLRGYRLCSFFYGIFLWIKFFSQILWIFFFF